MPSLQVRVTDTSSVGEVRRQATTLAESLSLEETVRGRVAIVATEAATNVHRHGGGGSIVLRAADDLTGKYVEITAIDHGQGIGDLDTALRDGFSTGGTAGNGLGAIARMSALFDVWSAPSEGTVLVARVGTSGNAPVDFGGICIPAPGEHACGDAWMLQQDGARIRVTVVDGLGHGLLASVAAREALSAATRTPRLAPAEVLDEMHGALRSTRGAAAGVGVIDLVTRKVEWAGVGNIAGQALAPGKRGQSFVSHNGIVGHTVRRVHPFTYDWPPYGMAIFHSDGLQTSWDVGRYPGLVRRHPSVVAGVLFRDYTRGRDDVTVIVAKERGESA